jgi:hypothetical protein
MSASTGVALLIASAERCDASAPCAVVGSCIGWSDKNLKTSVGVQVVPDQDDRRAELLAGGVQQPGVVRLGEPLALVAAPAADVDAVDQPGPLSGFTAISAASDTLLLLPPVTAPTGVLPRRPQVRPRVA